MDPVPVLVRGVFHAVCAPLPGRTVARQRHDEQAARSIG